jgi:restriction system protein
MSKRRKKSGADELLELLIDAPWWLGPLIAAVVFGVMRWALPLILGAVGSDGPAGSHGTTDVLSGISVQFAPLAGVAFLFLWTIAEVAKFARRRRFDAQTGPETIASLSWQQFESLLAEAFRRQGFAVTNEGGPFPDGGIDLRLDKAGATTLVQCKHWKSRSVGVKIVRELRGVMASEGAQSGIVVTSGTFTPDAIAFADSNPIRLIDGDELARMIAEVQSTPKKAAEPPRQSPTARTPALPASGPSQPPPPPNGPPCPDCGAPMLRRAARKGANAGQEFFGCSKFPKCRGTRPIDAYA